MTLDEARLMAGVRERSLRLFADGYRVRWREPEVLEVASPQGARYLVDTARGTCDCPFFRGHEGRHPCKHLLGWVGLLGEQRWARGRLALTVLLVLRAWAELDECAPQEPDEETMEYEMKPEEVPVEGGCRDAG